MEIVNRLSVPERNPLALSSLAISSSVRVTARLRIRSMTAASVRRRSQIRKWRGTCNVVQASVCQRMEISMALSSAKSVTSLISSPSSCLRSTLVVVAACQSRGRSRASCRIRWRSSGSTRRIDRRGRAGPRALAARLRPASRSSPAPESARPGGSPDPRPGSGDGPARLHTGPAPGPAATGGRLSAIARRSDRGRPLTPPAGRAASLRGRPASRRRPPGRPGSTGKSARILGMEPGTR